MECWNCGRAIALASAQTVLTRDTCPQCDADLHACRGCRHFDLTAHNECREVMAEWVRYKDRANYCDYFSPGGAAPPGGGQDKGGAASARDDFNRLFR
jgi:hypothetical protein